MALIETLATDEDALSLLSEAMNFDFASKGMDEPFTDDELANISGTQSMRDRVLRASGIKQSDAARLRQIQPVGRARTSRSSAARRKSRTGWRNGSPPVCDGFVVAATHVPGTYMEFVQHVVPELQRRGLYHKDYKGATLRENLGLPIPHATTPGRTHDETRPVDRLFQARNSKFRWRWSSAPRNLAMIRYGRAEAYGSDAVTPLAYLAALTKRIRLGTGIMQLAARTPANAAMCAGTVDAMAGGGRFIAGLGVSGPQIVEGWYGEPWGRPYYRIQGLCRDHAQDLPPRGAGHA